MSMFMVADKATYDELGHLPEGREVSVRSDAGLHIQCREGTGNLNL